MGLVESLGLQFFEVTFCGCVVLLVYACLQKAVLVSCLVGLIIFYSFRVIQERGTERITPDGRHVLITGCDTGIGKVLAKRLVAQGFSVLATCLDVNSSGASELKENGGETLHVLPLDVTSDDSVEACVKTVQQKLGDKGLWAIVNNAGVIGMGDVELLTMDMYKRLADVNLFGMIRTTKAFLPMIRKTKGRVINITSVRGVVAFPANSTYVVSKFGAEGFSDCLRMEMKRFGVNVVIVEPGNFGGATALWDEANVQRMRNANTEMISAASHDVITAYGPQYLDTMFEGAVKGCSTSFPNLEPVMAALVASVRSISPQNRYLVDGSNQWFDVDCVMARLRPFVPVGILDYLMLKVRGPPPVAAQPEFH
ncbi:D-beta-hydroxybutyrate dehydrogenase, mitochondrial-like [Haliotis cracherodii]|uniref:D-beta-hydroxybutyrate dehydrogenase, mitochondrial-like n=1 Tax=Haliotis cracherodii TaxID=6455 RepID=UPI0039E744D4